MRRPSHPIIIAAPAASLLALFLLLSGCAQPPAKPADPIELNKVFADEDVATWVERFEREGREVWDHRERVIQECELRPGMDLADIGAGTGLYTRLFAPAVGPEGRVYAVDVTPNFVAHVESSSREAGFQNVTGVLCDSESTGLEPNSIDLAYVCDTYHHFEKPASTLTSIHSALRDGGRFIVVDMKRVEGESSEWVLNHVRAGKEVFRQEIEAAGFRFVKEESFMEKTYFLVFEKAAS